MQAQPFDVIITDLRMPGKSGLKVIDQALAQPNKPAVIMMTAYGTIETAVEAMKRGAVDFITKPVNIERLEALIQRALKTKTLEIEVKQLHERLDEKYSFEGILGIRPKLQAVIDQVKLVAPSRATVLIEGESGTRQGIDRAGDPPGEPAGPGTLHRGALRGAFGEPPRERAFRARARRLHRRRGAAHRPVRVGRRRHAVPRRDQRDLARDPGEAPALPRDQGDRAGRRFEADRARRAPRRRDQPHPRGAGALRQVPRGPVLPAERRAAGPAAAARPAPRTSRCCSPTTSRSSRTRTTPRRSRSSRAPCGPCRPIPGRATSASCAISARTSSSPTAAAS